MSERPVNADFNYSNMDWEQYTAHRPSYPAELYQMVYDYHKYHGGDFKAALDIGGGNGIITREFLLKNFSHVTLSDLSDSYISQAKLTFAPIVDHKQLSFLTRKIEDVKPGDLPSGLVDLTTAGTCLHWAEALQVTPSAAQLIKPGGTFSAWCYGGQPVCPPSHPAVQKAWRQLFHRFIELYELKIGKLPENGPSANMNARFDNMPFDPKEWNNVRRIKVLPAEPMITSPVSAAEVRVLPEVESQEVLGNEAFITRKADYTWMEGYVQSLVPPINVQEDMAPELKELKNAVGDETIQLRWPFALVLATRR